MFASPGSDTRTFTLYFPKLYASVSKIQIKDGPGLRYLSATTIHSSLDGSSYEKVMDTNEPFCDENRPGSCACAVYTVKEYIFPEKRILKYLRISGKGKDSCDTSELSFVGIELFGYFTKYSIYTNDFVYSAIPLFSFTQLLRSE